MKEPSAGQAVKNINAAVKAIARYWRKAGGNACMFGYAASNIVTEIERLEEAEPKLIKCQHCGGSGIVKEQIIIPVVNTTV